MLARAGLSYTSFNLSLGATEPTGASLGALSPTDTVNVTVHVQNVGKVDGRTVAALYFAKPLSRFVRCERRIAPAFAPHCSSLLAR